MPQVNPSCYHLSASSIASFKACPTRFRLAYREGLRLAEDTESQRMGTNWHAMHEVYADGLSAYRAAQAEQGYTDEEVSGFATCKVVALLNEKYANTPSSKTLFEWNLERQILLTSFIGYLWYYQNDPIEFLVSELPFELPLHSPRTGLPIPTSEVLRVGKIDHVVRWQGAVCALERKSTSRSIDADSDYWDKSRKDTQVSMYALAFRDMNLASYKLVNLHPMKSGERFGNTLYDVWHKPTIKPKMLTQAETAAFLTTGEYMGQKFDVVNREPLPHPSSPVPDDRYIVVGGEYTLVEPGKKGFAIKETVEMFSARLLQDMYERPEFYFARREIVRTDADLRHFSQQLYSVYQAQKTYSKNNCWFENESQCRATFACSYIPICYGPGSQAVCDGKTTPPGFKRIFVDLTVNGEALED